MSPKKFIRAVLCSVAVAVTLLCLPASSQAGVMVFDLHNHPGGNAAPPTYGFRLDELYDVTGGHDIFTFDFNHAESTMKLFYDDGGTPDVLSDDLVTIRGYAYGGLDTGTGYTNAGYTGRWYIDFSYRANLVADPNEPALHEDLTVKVNPESSLNNGTIMAQFLVGNLDLPSPIDLTDEDGGKGFSFKFNNFDNHRLGGTGLSGPDTYVGWGWVNHGGQPHVAASDWLFIGTESPVPEPTSLSLLAIGFLGVGGLARRKRKRLQSHG